jgi:hypothetical protein
MLLQGMSIAASPCIATACWKLSTLSKCILPSGGEQRGASAPETDEVGGEPRVETSAPSPPADASIDPPRLAVRINPRRAGQAPASSALVS